MLIKGSSWTTGIHNDDKARYGELVTTGDEKMVEGKMMLQYKASTTDLTIEELLELRGILGRGRAPWVEALALEQMDKIIGQRQDPLWIAEQEKKARERKDKQEATEARLLAQGSVKLGGGEGDLWRERKDRIDAWWAGLKEREQAETWQAVLAANRMSARQIGSTTVMGGEFTVRNKFARHDKARGRKIRLDRSADGIVTRLTPTNFYDPITGKSRKDELGLHDLSATLLDGTKNPLTIQGQLKPYKDSVVVFMPVPTEDDAQIFNAITHLVAPEEKALGIMRSSFTRLKFAQGSDMHTTMMDVSLRAEDPPKIRYGVTGRAQRAKDEEEMMADEIDLAARRTNALEHSVILGAGAIQKVNEIVMAYRSHASALFPLFAKWDGKRFNVLARTSWRPTGAYLTDDGVWHAK